MHQEFADFRKANDSFKREVLHSILIEFGISEKLFTLIMMCIDGVSSRVHLGKLPLDPFPSAQ